MASDERKITIYDIAKACDVSASTVSRVLNGSVLINDSSKKMILQTAETLGYQKRTIKRHKSRAILNIVIFMPDISDNISHLLYNISELVEGLQKGFGSIQVNFILKINKNIENMFSHKKLGDIDGCIFAFTEPVAAIIEELRIRDIPILLLNRKHHEFNYVKYDDAQCMATLLEKVVAKKFDRHALILKPCYIGYSPLGTINKSRQNGFIKACEHFNIEIDAQRDCFSFNNFNYSADFIKALKAQGYNAIFCFNDMVALSIYQVASLQQLSIPGDFSLTGFDDSPVQAILNVKINTIRFNVFELGFEGGKWLYRWVVKRDEKTLNKLIVGAYVAGDTI